MARDLTTNYPCDLHCHTIRSDGADSPAELCDHAASLGMQVIAITDHDIDPPRRFVLADGREIDSREYAAEQGLLLVLGDEFSTNTWVDEVHICGYELDWELPELQAEVAAARQSKTEAYQELCRRLTALGMAVDWARDVLQFTDFEGQVHQRTADEVERKHIFEAMAGLGYAESWSAAKLLVRDNPELNVRRRKIDSVACIQLIQRCGGVAVLAHPYLIDEWIAIPGQPSMARQAFIDALVEAGLDGIEVRYTYDKTTYRGQMTPEEIEQEVRQRYAGRLPILSGGSDYHAGQKKGEKKLRILGERGLTGAEFAALKDLIFRR
ncbi:MAG: PHP domain-containing protein [Anaerolineales bacterium]|jgi:hypothetical protein|nr:PHP domain-containing protein [Anaerolineales bacterium]